MMMMAMMMMTMKMMMMVMMMIVIVEINVTMLVTEKVMICMPSAAYKLCRIWILDSRE